MLAAIREFSPAIRARAPEIEQARRMPADLARTLATAGLFRMAVPEDAGGLELEPARMLRAIEAAGAADASVGWCMIIGATSGVAAASADAVGAQISGLPIPLSAACSRRWGNPKSTATVMS